MAKKRKHSTGGRRRKRSHPTGHRRRSTHRRSRGLLGAAGNDTGSKLIGIGIGAAGAMFAEGMIAKRRPLNPMLVGGGEVIAGLYLSNRGGMTGYVGDGLIAQGMVNLVSVLMKRMHGRGGGIHGPEYVIDGTDYITGSEMSDLMVDENTGYVVTGTGEYVTGINGAYVTEQDLQSAMMGYVNQGGLGYVNQGGLG